MEDKKITPKKVLRSIALFIVFTGIGFFAGKMGVSASGSMSKGSFITLMLLFIPLFFTVIAVHEAGHAIAGVVAKFTFKTYIVGPLMWQKDEGGVWRFQWNKKVNTAGGLVICMPNGTENLDKRFSLYAAGGPIASLVLTVLAYAIYSVMAPTNTALEIVRQSLYIVAFLSLIIFIFTALPLRTGGFSSDGARVLRLLQGGDTARFELLLLQLITNASAGVRPRDINLQELNEALVLAQKIKAPFGVYLHSFYHQAALDQDNYEEAEKHLLDYIAGIDSIPKGIRNIVWLDAAFFYAYAKEDLEQAETYWQQYQPAALIPKAQQYATEAAIALLKKDTALATAKLDQALIAIPNMLDTGLGVALRDRIERMKDKEILN
jgi:hypothetical protein